GILACRNLILRGKSLIILGLKWYISYLRTCASPWRDGGNDFFEARIHAAGPVRRQLQVDVCQWAGGRMAIASCSTSTLLNEPPNARISTRNYAPEASGVVKVA